MSSIVVPAPLAPLIIAPTPPAVAARLADDLRAVTVALKDAQAGVEERGAPADWQGEAAQAAEDASTRTARRLAIPEQALLVAATAADAFVDTLEALATRRVQLEGRCRSYSDRVDDLTERIDQGGATADAAQEQAWRAEAARLTTERAGIEDDIARWYRDAEAADAAFVAALRGVDTEGEAAASARAPGQPDVAALTARLQSLTGDPEALHAWWTSLSAAEREALLTEHPELVGNADGLPVSARDDANRARLTRDLDYLGEREADGQLSDDERAQLDNARSIQRALDERVALIDPVTGESLLNVIVYKPDAHTGDGGVAVSIGDPDTADHVATFVPGLTNDTSSLSGNLDSIKRLYDAALDEHSGSVATVFWLDYDAPSGDLTTVDGITDFAQVVGPLRAAQGGAQFADFIAGLRASDEGSQAHLTAIGHSYGSTTVGWGLRDGADVDEAVIIGSPGQPALSASGLTDAPVWVGSMDRDPVTLLGTGARGGIGTLGVDPATVGFGGTRFTTDEGSYRVEHLIDNHSSYFGGRSLDNMAAIVTDHPDEVEVQAPRMGGNYQTLTELLAGTTAASAGEQLVDLGVRAGDAVIDTGGRVIDFGGAVLSTTGHVIDTGIDAGVDAAADAGGWLIDRVPGL